MPCHHGEAEPLAPVGGVRCDACSHLLAEVWWSMTSLYSKTLWVVAIGYYGKPFAEGVVQTELEACAAAHAATSQKLPTQAAVIFNKRSDAMAEKRARELRAEVRLSRLGKSAGPQVVEYVYQHQQQWELSGDFKWSTLKAKVLRKTAKQVFVEDTESTYTTASGVLVLRTYCLDRAELERTGKSRRWVIAPNPPYDGGAKQPAWADVLGVKSTCSLVEAKRAYRRKAAAAHPDKGGNEADFHRITEAFKAASGALR